MGSSVPDQKMSTDCLDILNNALMLVSIDHESKLEILRIQENYLPGFATHQMTLSFSNNLKTWQSQDNLNISCISSNLVLSYLC